MILPNATHSIILHFASIRRFTLFSPLSMVNVNRIILLFALLCYSCVAKAQADSNTWTPIPAPAYGFVKPSENKLANTSQLDSVFYKLQSIRRSHSGRLNIIHIGDSHIQADGMTSVVREGMQDFFGNAGRGLVFPYQLAGSNAPLDIRSGSNTSWKSNRLTFPDKPIATGVSGYGIHSGSQSATVTIGLKDMEGKQERFNHMVFFLCNETVCYQLSDSGMAAPVTFYTQRNANNNSVTVNTDEMITGFRLARVNAPDNADYSFYGVSLEKRDTPGVLYHSIGVNGARYDQYVQNEMFWDQLKELHGDLFIISMGTNEAQTPALNQAAFIAGVSAFVQMIHKTAPNAAIIITTPAGSYYRKKKPNKAVESVATALDNYCKASGITCWDLFKVSGGMAGTVGWKKTGLISHDLVHYNNAGYKLQGLLLLNAMAKAYNQYTHLHPYKPAKPAVPAPKKTEVKIPKVQTEIQKPEYPQPAVRIQPPAVQDSVQKPKIPVTEPAVRPGSHIKVEYSD